MGSEAALEEAKASPRLPLFSIPATMASPEPSGMLTPPFHATASVPFRWEEQPGKPRPTSSSSAAAAAALLSDPSSYRLDLPPRLHFKIPKLPSPTTVLDGPYKRSRRESRTIVLGKVGGLTKRREKSCLGMFRSSASFPWRKKEKRGNCVFSAPVGGGDEWEGVCGHGKTTVTKKSGFPSLPPRAGDSHFWASIYERLKRVLPWKSRKMKKDGLMVMDI